MAGDGGTEQTTETPAGGTRVARNRPRTHVPEQEIAQIRDVSFPVAMRGYEREAVDAYVSRVNRLLAELQITAAPEAAIRHALDQVADETRGILERAHETAEEITRRSRSQADDRLQRAEHEAEQVRKAADDYASEIRDAAEKRLAALQADADRIWQERQGLVADLRERSRQLEQVATVAEERYPSSPDVDRRTTPEEPATTAPPAPAAAPASPPEEDEDPTRDIFDD